MHGIPKIDTMEIFMLYNFYHNKISQKKKMKKWAKHKANSFTVAVVVYLKAGLLVIN